MSSTENFCNNNDGDTCTCNENFDKKKRIGRGAVTSGLTHECGVFGAIGTGEWPTHLEVAQIICWGLVALQHRFVNSLKICIVIFLYSTTQMFFCNGFLHYSC